MRPDRDAAGIQELPEDEGREVAEGLHDAHQFVVLGGRGLDQHVAPEGELIQEPLALVQITARAKDHDLLVHGDRGRAEQRVQADDGSGVALEHRFEGLALEAGDVSQDAAGRKVRANLAGHGPGDINGHSQQT